MKTLLIMRHAKSSWGDDGLPDYERPLNGRGKRDAPRMGKLLKREGFVPQAIAASSATRARATAQAVAEACGFEGEVDFRPELYGAEPTAMLRVLAGLSDMVQVALLVGHNPESEALLAELTGEDEVLPTGAIAHTELDLSRWSELARDSSARLIQVWRPREIK